VINSAANSNDTIILSEAETYFRPKLHIKPGLEQRISLSGTTARAVVSKFNGMRFYSDGPLLYDRNGVVVAETTYLIDMRNFDRDNPTYKQKFLCDEACYCIGYNVAAANYYHWMTQCLTSIYSYTLAKNAEQLNVLLPALQPFQRETFELAGLDVRLAFVEPHTCYDMSAVLMSNYLHGTMDYSPSPLVKPLFDKIRDAALRGHNSTPDVGLIYISRSDSRNRPLVNEDALMGFLSDLGFRILVLSKLSLTEQISAFASAKLIVAPHGAGLTNLVFSKATCKVYELSPDHYVNSCFVNLAQMGGIEYWLEVHPCLGEGPDHERTWRADLKQVGTTVESILESVEG
jgi:hypothetical protein